MMAGRSGDSPVLYGFLKRERCEGRGEGQITQFTYFWAASIRHFPCGPQLSKLACYSRTLFFPPDVSSVKPESAIAIIPARYQSTRLPGKPVLKVQGKTLIEHVYRRVQSAESVARILVATDDDRIASAVREFGGEVAMTHNRHQSGTDRLA